VASWVAGWGGCSLVFHFFFNLAWFRGGDAVHGVGGGETYRPTNQPSAIDN
jgi:hypothetical protein